MQKSASDVVLAQDGNKLPAFERQIGATTYRVNLNFSATSTETIEDKLLRLMENEVCKIA